MHARATSAPHQLTTVCFSHFCEKARWALDRCGVPYRERGFMPLFHFPAVAMQTLGRGAGQADGASTRFSTPLLRTPDGELICDSSDIVAYVDRTFAGGALDTGGEGALDRKLSQDLGPHTRRVVYFYLLERPHLLDALAEHNVGRLQALAFRPLRDVVARAIKKSLGVHSRGAARSEEKTRACADDVAARLADGRPYLMGERFTAADLSFAALFAPAVAPPEYGAWLPPVEQLPDGARRLVDDMREHPAGRFAARIYATERARRA